MTSLYHNIIIPKILVIVKLTVRSCTLNHIRDKNTGRQILFVSSLTLYVNRWKYLRYTTIRYLGSINWLYHWILVWFKCKDRIRGETKNLDQWKSQLKLSFRALGKWDSLRNLKNPKTFFTRNCSLSEMFYGMLSQWLRIIHRTLGCVQWYIVIVNFQALAILYFNP